MKLYRQGDVLFQRIRSLPAGNQKKRENGTVAYGEVTGHSHTVMSPDQAEVVEIDGAVFVHVNERGVSIQGDVERILPDVQRIVEDETESPLRRESARQLLEALPTAGALFLHGTQAERTGRPVPTRHEDRHLPTALAPGNHTTIIQREYSPEAIRNVVD